MRILVTGAYGFIGSHIVTGLRAAGHEVVGCGRDTGLGLRLHPDIEWIACDFNRDTAPEVWRSRIAGIDAVINCAGILQGSRRYRMEAIHRDTPAALFQACAEQGPRRVIQISALGAGLEAGTAFAATKQAADEILMGLDLDWVVLRPSMIHSRGCYGGTALMRGLAALPILTPLPGRGGQRFQPIHMSDLVRAVVRLVEPDAPSRVLLNAVGPEVMTLRQMIAGIRRWLGLPPTRYLPAPMPLVRLLARAGDALYWLGVRGALCTTTLRQMAAVNTADPAPFAEAVGFMPRRFAEAMATEPAELQDRWHARLFFLRPLLSATLAMFWVGYGVAGVLMAEQMLALLDPPPIGVDRLISLVPMWLGLGATIMLATLLLLRQARTGTGLLLLIMAVAYVSGQTGYTAFIAETGGPRLSQFWLLVPNLPLIAATLVMLAIEDDR